MRPEIQWSPGVLLYLAALLLTLPWQWIASAIAAICIHELCHAGVALVLGYPIWRFCVGFSGVKMETSPMEPLHELLCALAGPLGGLLTLPFARIIPGVCVCAAIHTLYNLLPIYPSDGGRALLCAARLLFPEKVAFAMEQVPVVQNFSLADVMEADLAAREAASR